MSTQHTAKQQYKLAHRYHRVKKRLSEALDEQRYPIGFDCPNRNMCGDMCYCYEEAERETTIVRAWQAEMDRLTPLLQPEMVRIAFAERLKWIRFNDGDFGVFWGYGTFCHFAGLRRSGYIFGAAYREYKLRTERGLEWRRNLLWLFFARYPRREK